MNLEIQILLLLILLSVLVVGVLVMIKNARSVVNRSFFVFLIGIILFIGGFLLMSIRYPFDVFDKMIHYGGLILLLGLFMFSQVFPSGTGLPRKRWPLYIPFGLIALAVIPFDLLIKEAPFEGAGVAPSNGPLLFPYMIFWGCYFLLSVYFLIRTYRKTKGTTRMQMKYLFTGIVIVLSSFFIFDLVLPLLGVSSLSFLGPVSSVILVYLTGYAILRHSLLDIRVVIQRGLIYVVLIGIITGIYSTSLQLLVYFFHQATNISIMICAGAIMVLGILFFQRIENYFRTITDPIFFKDRYDYAESMHKLSKILHTHIAKADIIRESSLFLNDMFKPEWLLFNFSKEDRPRETPEDALLISIVFDEEHTGTLELGPKKSGDSYTPRDKQLLETFAHHAGVALQKGWLYEKVEQYSSHLEQLVEERTGEIKKLQEDQKQTMLDISHNLQTPLAVIKCELELLGDSFPDNEKIYTIKKSIHKVSELIRQLLHLAKLENRAFGIELVLINFTSLINESVEYFEVMTEEKGISLISSIPSGKISILGNKKLLIELLTNLVTNSIKYRSPGKKNTISISLSETDTMVRLAVADNGIGISKEDLPKIFTRFYRGFHGKDIKGTGLGLAICQKIVENHNGTISVVSIPGETTFTILFPSIPK